MQKKLIGIILTVLGVVGAFLAAMPYLDGNGRNYNEGNINLYGFISMGIFLAGVLLILTNSTKEPSR